MNDNCINMIYDRQESRHLKKRLGYATLTSFHTGTSIWVQIGTFTWWLKWSAVRGNSICKRWDIYLGPVRDLNFFPVRNLMFNPDWLCDLFPVSNLLFLPCWDFLFDGDRFLDGFPFWDFNFNVDWNFMFHPNGHWDFLMFSFPNFLKDPGKRKNKINTMGKII